LRIRQKEVVTYEIRYCKDCNSPFTCKIKHNKEYCCRQCSKAYRNRLRSARKKTHECDDIKFYIIAERDKGKCGICGLAVDFSKTKPHPLSPSLDHCVPISHNGTHTYDNIQLSHLYCNRKKSDRLDYHPTVEDLDTINSLIL